MSQHPSRQQAVELDLMPQLRAIGIDPDDVDIEAIAQRTVTSTTPFSGGMFWQSGPRGEALRRIAEQHRRN